MARMTTEISFKSRGQSLPGASYGTDKGLIMEMMAQA